MTLDLETLEHVHGILTKSAQDARAWADKMVNDAMSDETVARASNFADGYEQAQARIHRVLCQERPPAPTTASDEEYIEKLLEAGSVHHESKGVGDVKYVSKQARVGVIWESGHVESIPLDRAREELHVITEDDFQCTSCQGTQTIQLGPGVVEPCPNLDVLPDGRAACRTRVGHDMTPYNPIPVIAS